MNRLITFFRRISLPLLFIVLEAVAINYYATSTPYRKARLLAASSSVSGGVHNMLHGVTDYFSLRRRNAELAEEVARLNNELSRTMASAREGTLLLPPGSPGEEYFFSVAEVVNNSIARSENFLVLTWRGGAAPPTNTAVLTTDGAIAGYVLNSRGRYAAAISVLNTNFRTGGQIKGKEYFGSVRWDGESGNYVTLSEISGNAVLNPGDTVTTVYSSIFPTGALIGTVESFEKNTSGYYDARVRLAAGMDRLRQVVLVDYASKQDRLLLEEGLNSEGEQHVGKEP